MAPAADDEGVRGVRPIQYTITDSTRTAEAVAMLEDWITETGHVPRTLRLDGAKESVGRCDISVAGTISHVNLACAQMAVTAIRQ